MRDETQWICLSCKAKKTGPTSRFWLPKGGDGGLMPDRTYSEENPTKTSNGVFEKFPLGVK